MSEKDRYAHAYVWLEVIKRRLIADLVCECEIEAIEEAQKIIRSKITGYSEE